MTKGTCGLDGVTVGIWIDDPPKMVATPEYFDKLREHNIDLVDIMIDTMRPGWDPKYSRARLAKIGRLAQAAGVRVALTVWPDPVKSHMRDMAKGVVPLVEAAGAVEVCVDTEFNWKHSKVQGIKRDGVRSALDLAGDFLVDRLLEVKAATGCTLSLSTFPNHLENGTESDLAPHVDLLLPQAYSVRQRKRKNPKTGRYDLPWLIGADHAYGPGGMQRYTLDKTEAIAGVADGKIELGIGLACYDQKFPGLTVAQAMAEAFDASTGRGCTHVRYWSSKWAIGVRSEKNKAAGKFLRSLRQR